jgi:hypothetical protein
MPLWVENSSSALASGDAEIWKLTPWSSMSSARAVESHAIVTTKAASTIR